MSRMKWFYVAFWVIVGSMLFWQFHSYNRGLDKAVVDAGHRQEHFYFLNAAQTNTTIPDASPVAKVDAANVKQVGFSFVNHVPNEGSFTCHVSLKNDGNLKATGVQVQVSPYLGSDEGEEANEPNPLRAVTINEPAGQYNQWVTFPDLEPGQTVTQDVVFQSWAGFTPGDNARPQIIFHTAKPPAPPAPAPTP